MQTAGKSKKANLSTKIPAHLSADTRRWVLDVAGKWVLEPHHERILLLAACCWDRQRAAEALLKAEGLTVTDKYGQTKPHPAISAEKEARNGFLKAIKQLNLTDSEQIKAPAWGPMPASKK